MSSGGFKHVSVMAEEVMQYLQPHSGGVYLDGTLGGAGHARLILEASSPDGVLIGMDRDAEALAAAQRELASFGERVVLRQGNFSDMCMQLDQLEIAAVDGILLDLGVSSHQIDSPERGFSFREDGPLDMRMNPKEGVSAATVVAETEADELKRIFRDYGEERWAGKIARAIVTDREKTPFVTTLQLADLISRVVPAGRGPQRIHPATRVFQALRIHVNGELDSLRTALDTAWLRLKTGGRLVVISFHSLEDRMVKHFMRVQAKGEADKLPRNLPIIPKIFEPKMKLLGKPQFASDAEIRANPRSRSAVMRVAEKLQ